MFQGLPEPPRVKGRARFLPVCDLTFKNHPAILNTRVQKIRDSARPCSKQEMEYESLSNIILGSFWVILSLASLLLQLRIEVTQAMRNTENSSKGSLRTNHDCVVHSRPSQPEIDLIFPGPWVQPWP